MPQGLQIWDSSGNLVFDTNTAAGRVLGVTDITASTSGSVTNAGLATGTAFCFFQTKSTSYFTAVPSITLSGTTLSWDNGSGTNAFLVYGVY